jgi:uncharacterized membrane protein YoaK (UPF0700 family)
MVDEPEKPAPATTSSAAGLKAVGGAARSSQARARREERLAAGLATIAGFVDAYGLITFGVYVSFMSGNTTKTGYLAGEGAFAAAALSALAILFFVGGSFAGSLLAQFAGRFGRRLVFCAVAAALAAIVCLTQLGDPSGGLPIAIVSFAMGVMNSALSRVGAQSVILTFVTGTLSRVGSHLALAVRRASPTDAQGPWDTHLRRALLLARVWAGFFAGAILSGAATPRLGACVLLAPVLVLATMAAFDRPGRAAA